MPNNPNQVSISKLSHFLSTEDILTPQQKYELIMQTKHQRQSYNKQVTEYNGHLFNNQIILKAAVSVTLGIGLFFAAPATLLLGGAVALTLGSGIYTLLPFPQTTINKNNLPVRLEGADNENAPRLVDEWLNKVKDHELTDEQSRLYHNMYRIGVGLIVGFAAFTAIASGAGLAVTLTASLYALTLFYFVQSQPTLYIDEEPANTGNLVR